MTSSIWSASFGGFRRPICLENATFPTVFDRRDYDKMLSSPSKDNCSDSTAFQETGLLPILYTGQIKEYLLATYSLRIDFFYLTGFLRKSRCFQSVCTMFLYQYAHEYLSKEVKIFSAHLHDVYLNICTYAFIHIHEDIGTNLATTTEKSSKVWKFEPPNPSYETNVHTHMPNSLSIMASRGKVYNNDC